MMITNINKKRGRPNLYDHQKILTTLKKYEGKQKGLTHAHQDIRKLKNFKSISKATLSSVAKRYNIKFGLGKPKPPKSKKVA